MGEDYRIRLDDAERHMIVVALAEHLRSIVRRAKRAVDIRAEAALLERLANPRAWCPGKAYWAWGWTTKKRGYVYKRLDELVTRSKGVVKAEESNII